MAHDYSEITEFVDDTIAAAHAEAELIGNSIVLHAQNAVPSYAKPLERLTTLSSVIAYLSAFRPFIQQSHSPVKVRQGISVEGDEFGIGRELYAKKLEDMLSVFTVSLDERVSEAYDDLMESLKDMEVSSVRVPRKWQGEQLSDRQIPVAAVKVDCFKRDTVFNAVEKVAARNRMAVMKDRGYRNSMSDILLYVHLKKSEVK